MQKGYLIFTYEKEVKSYIEYVAVPKGLDDIQMVFNGSSCGLNLSLFAPNFWLPMSNTMTILLSFGYRVVDMDIGDFFPIFPIHPSLRSHSGIDVSPIRQALEKVIPVTMQHNKRLSAT